MKILFSNFKPILVAVITMFVVQCASIAQQKESKNKQQANHKYQSAVSLTKGIERLLTNAERRIISSAEAMPADKFYFTPESLNIDGSNFKGVRTYAGQIMHLATDNYLIWSTLTGDPLPDGINDVNGPEHISTKAAIIRYLKDSFALGHKAISKLTNQNAMEMLPFRYSKLPKLDLAFYALNHASEHYGQMVIYLRACGIVPPATIAENQ